MLFMDMITKKKGGNYLRSKKPFRKLGLFEGYTLSIAISKLGNQIFYIVVPLYIYKETESAFLMGMGWFFNRHLIC